MSRVQAVLHWLEARSDWLNPIVVKEVRQVVRGREFNYSFVASLVSGVAVAFFGAADALAGGTGAGRWTFFALIGCLGFVGLGVVPLGAFSALRTERMEQTLDLMTLTALSPRRLVVGKLLAQGVKLITLFSAIAPFIAMSFLLGGIDFVTILVSLAALFMWALWACSLCLFLSTLLKSRAMSGLVFGAIGIMMLLIFTAARMLFFAAQRGALMGGPAFGPATSDFWWVLAMATTVCVVTAINFVLLAENRLSLPTENRVTTLRIGFFGQFAALALWILTFVGDPASTRDNAVDVLGTIGGIHLAMVAIFTVSEDLFVSRRVQLGMPRRAGWAWLLAVLYPGGGRGAVYVLLQMAAMMGVAVAMGASALQMRWLLAICGYICFFTGVPTLLFRRFAPERPALHLRVALVLLLPLAMTLPDIVHYLVSRNEVLDLNFGARHLLNPFRTVVNWQVVEARRMFFLPLLIGLTGLIAYVGVIHLGRLAAQPVAIDPRRAAAGEPGSADAIY